MHTSTKEIVSKISRGRKFFILDSHSHLHPAKANYSPHGNLAGSSHQKITSVHQAIIPDESALLPLLATHICLSVPLLITIFLQTEPDPARSVCFWEFVVTLEQCWWHTRTSARCSRALLCPRAGRRPHTLSVSPYTHLQARWVLTAEVNLSFRWQNVEFFTALFLLSQLTLYTKTKLMTCKRHSPRLQKNLSSSILHSKQGASNSPPVTFFVKRRRIKSAGNFQFNYRRPQPVVLNCPCCY